MANYPSPPGLRVPYDSDGSAGFYYYGASSTVGRIAQGDLQNLNSNVLADPPSYLQAPFNNIIVVGMVFAFKWDMTGYYFDKGSSGFPGAFEWSPNSTNGLDGTWNTVASPAVVGVNDLADGYRRSIQSASETGVKAVRLTGVYNLFNGSYNPKAYHVYGEPSAGQTIHALMPWNPTLNQFADGSTMDFADIQQAATEVLQFRIKNYSSLFTSHDTLLTASAYNDTSPSMITQFEFSLDNVTWFSVLNIGTLTPGALSAIIYVRDAVAINEPVSVHELKLIATPTSWS